MDQSDSAPGSDTLPARSPLTANRGSIKSSLHFAFQISNHALKVHASLILDELKTSVVNSSGQGTSSRPDVNLGFSIY